VSVRASAVVRARGSTGSLAVGIGTKSGTGAGTGAGVAGETSGEVWDRNRVLAVTRSFIACSQAIRRKAGGFCCTVAAYLATLLFSSSPLLFTSVMLLRYRVYSRAATACAARR
jgi:hypothetical protein